MNTKNANALYDAQTKGFRIKLSSRYVDGFATLHKSNDGKITLNSSVYSDLDMSNIHLHEISVYKEVAIEDFINWNDE
jgi:hypothetical protein